MNGETKRLECCKLLYLELTARCLKSVESEGMADCVRAVKVSSLNEICRDNSLGQCIPKLGAGLAFQNKDSLDVSAHSHLQF